MRVWFYEKTGELKAEITADRAVHNEATNIWEATGNVMLINSEGQKLETEQLFWNAGKGTVYSEKYTKITQKNGTVSSGDSFRARQDLSGYTLGNRSGVGRTTIFLEDEENSENKP